MNADTETSVCEHCKHVIGQFERATVKTQDGVVHLLHSQCLSSWTQDRLRARAFRERLAHDEFMR